MVEVAQRRPAFRPTGAAARISAATGHVSFRSLSTNPKRRPSLTAERLAKLRAKETAMRRSWNALSAVAAIMLP